MSSSELLSAAPSRIWDAPLPFVYEVFVSLDGCVLEWAEVGETNRIP